MSGEDKKQITGENMNGDFKFDCASGGFRNSSHNFLDSTYNSDSSDSDSNNTWNNQKVVYKLAKKKNCMVINDLRYKLDDIEFDELIV